MVHVLCGFEAWSPTFRQERSLKVLGKSSEKNIWDQKERSNR
jgi:hypothetical protein